MKSEKVLITGVTGQDGALLAKFFVDQGKKVYGTFRKTSSNNLWRLEHLRLLDDIVLVEHIIGQDQNLFEILKRENFSEIYHLAGDSRTLDSYVNISYSINTNINGTIEILEGVQKFSQQSKVFIAGSAEIFDTHTSESSTNLVDEGSLKGPQNPYGIACLTNKALVDLYRTYHNLNLCYGIMFNHESTIRGDGFVTKKITKGLSSIKFNKGGILKLGNFSSMRDWSAATDFVAAMALIGDAGLNEDFILASGTLHHVRDILTFAARALDFDPEFVGNDLQEICIDKNSGIILAQSDPKFLRFYEENFICGDSSKINRALGWQPTITFEDLITEMTIYDADRALKFGR
jgi:GDPmannose 4,6-dehydratase